MRLLDGFNLFFNPAFAIEKLFTLWGGDSGGKGGDTPDAIPILPARVNTGFGSARVDPQTGRYSYTLNPRLAAMRDIFYGGAQEFVPNQEQIQFAQGVSNQGMGLFGQGSQLLNQALATDTAGLGQKYYSDIQNLMATDRAEEEARLANTLFKTGRTGVGTGVQGGYVNPEQFALLRARELANQQLAIQAEDLGRGRRAQDVGFATGLQGQGLQQFGAGFQAGATPYQTAASVFGLGTGIEQLGFAPLNVGMQALNAQLMQQQMQQQYENAKAASGGKGGLGGLISTGLDIYGATQGFPGLGSTISGSSPSSGLSGIFGGGGWGNANAGTPLGTWTPINTNIGMGGYQAPANFGGGTLAPRF